MLAVPAQQREPSQAQRPHGAATKHASGSGLGLGFRLGVQPPLAEAENNMTVEKKIPYKLVTKPYPMETASFFMRAHHLREFPALSDLHELPYNTFPPLERRDLQIQTRCTGRRVTNSLTVSSFWGPRESIFQVRHINGGSSTFFLKKKGYYGGW